MPYVRLLDSQYQQSFDYSSLQQPWRVADMLNSLRQQRAALEEYTECRKGIHRTVVYFVYMFVCYSASLAFLRFDLLFRGVRGSVEEQDGDRWRRGCHEAHQFEQRWPAIKETVNGCHFGKLQPPKLPHRGHTLVAGS